MRSRLVTTLVLAVLAIRVHPFAAADPPGPPIPVVIDARGGVLVAVSVDEAGPFTFVLDTGASRTIIADDLARRLAARVVARSEVVTSGGTDARPVVQLRTVKIGTARVGGILAPVLPALRLTPLGRNVRGILGQDFLSAHNYTLDYRRGRLTWDTAVACGGSEAVALAASEGRFVARVHDEDSSTTLHLVPDSGAEALVLFRALPGMRALAMTVGIAGSGRPAERMAPRRLRVGSRTLQDIETYAIDRTDTEVDGLLPLHRFASVSFAAGGSCMIAR